MLTLKPFIAKLQSILAANERVYGPDDEYGMIDAPICVVVDNSGYMHMDYIGVDIDGTIILQAVAGHGNDPIDAAVNTRDIVNKQEDDYMCPAELSTRSHASARRQYDYAKRMIKRLSVTITHAQARIDECELVIRQYEHVYGKQTKDGGA